MSVNLFTPLFHGFMRKLWRTCIPGFVKYTIARFAAISYHFHALHGGVPQPYSRADSIQDQLRSAMPVQSMKNFAPASFNCTRLRFRIDAILYSTALGLFGINQVVVFSHSGRPRHWSKSLFVSMLMFGLERALLLECVLLKRAARTRILTTSLPWCTSIKVSEAAG
jgi:hypothetical protein